MKQMWWKRIGAIGCALVIAINGAQQVTAGEIEEKCQTLQAQWKERLAGKEFDSLVVPPFVIAGDGGLTRLARYRDATILPAQRALRTMYFKTEPSEPILILLFESEEPYRRLAKEWFNDRDVSRFGYFRHDNVMLMNVGTGLGTLVHELTHALMRPDFPKVPDWFNEGLASLYEQSSMGEKSITGHENWRLPALQKAIKEGSARSLDDLLADEDFYNAERTGLNYAEARYLMMYLQEKGQLTNFYAKAKENIAKDPTGAGTLKQIVGPQSMEEFEKDWRKWVMGLRFQ